MGKHQVCLVNQNTRPKFLMLSHVKFNRKLTERINNVLDLGHKRPASQQPLLVECGTKKAFALLQTHRFFWQPLIDDVHLQVSLALKRSTETPSGPIFYYVCPSPMK